MYTPGSYPQSAAPLLHFSDGYFHPLTRRLIPDVPAKAPPGISPADRKAAKDKMDFSFNHFKIVPVLQLRCSV